MKLDNSTTTILIPETVEECGTLASFIQVVQCMRDGEKP